MRPLTQERSRPESSRELETWSRFSTPETGLLRELSPEPLAPEARITPLDQTATWKHDLQQDTDSRTRYNPTGQDTRLSSERPGICEFVSRWRNVSPEPSSFLLGHRFEPTRRFPIGSSSLYSVRRPFAERRVRNWPENPHRAVEHQRHVVIDARRHRLPRVSRYSGSWLGGRIRYSLAG